MGNVPSSMIESNLEKIPGSGLENILRCVRRSVFALYLAGYSDCTWECLESLLESIS